MNSFNILDSDLIPADSKLTFKSKLIDIEVSLDSGRCLDAE